MLVLDGENPVAELAFTPDGTRLVVLRVRTYPDPPTAWPPEVLTIATGERMSLPKPPAAIWPSLAVHPSGRLALLAEGGPLRIADLSAGIVMVVPGSDASAVIVSPDGRRAIASRAGGSGHLSAFRLNPDGGPVSTSDWSAAPRGLGERLAGFLDGGSKFVTVGARRIVVRDTDSGEVAGEFKYPADSAILPTLSADGTRLAVRSTSQFYLYDVATWTIRYQLATEMRPFVRFTYHPTRPLLAVVSHGQTLVKYMDADTGKITAKFGWRLGEVRAVCFSPDGTLCAAGTAGGKVVVWDVD